jgi:hypothetical protein
MNTTLVPLQKESESVPDLISFDAQHYIESFSTFRNYRRYSIINILLLEGD